MDTGQSSSAKERTRDGRARWMAEITSCEMNKKGTKGEKKRQHRALLAGGSEIS